jgi:glycosyltransferase involved in cell wall biosynthesis
VTGLLYPPGDVDALAAALTALASDRGSRARLGAAGRQEARRFAPEVVAAETMQVYQAISSGRAAMAPSPT